MTFKSKVQVILLCSACVLLGIIIANTLHLNNTGIAVDKNAILHPENIQRVALTTEEKNLAQSIDNLFTKISSESKKSVVYIFTEREIHNKGPMFDKNDPMFQGPMKKFFEDFFGQMPNIPQKTTSLGSGIIISADGYILTNYHVVEKADKIKVLLSDKKKYKAELIGKDKKSDIAIIKIEPDSALKPITFGNSDKIKVGQTAIAIGNPFGYEYTVTVGHISATGRVLGIAEGSFEDFIQTDASINPGNSGGPLLNLYGEVIGINTAIRTNTGGFMGIGFAVPSNLAKEVAQQIIEYGKVKRPWLGIYIQDLTPEMAQHLDEEVKKGVMVSDVVKGSPAEKYGLDRGDIIISIDNVKVSNAHELQKEVLEHKIGDEVDIYLFRKGEKIHKKIVLGELKDNTQASTASDGTEEEQKQEEVKVKIKKFGIEVSELNDNIREHLGIDKEVEGLVITSILEGSSASDANLRRGDIIIEANYEPIKTIKDFKEALKKKEDSLLLAVQRGQRSFYVVLEAD